ncbi:MULTISPECIES: phage tail protein [Citrobacter]|uniref:phage tail protein n=1 Tax=Citrobacter TaxID=544 RepID=UPI002000261F|nr:phage tail protein [Citrobacter braakii]MCK2155259.1 phage tail protein [Citrobacter braakii]
MLKINSLRQALTDANQWCRANPEAFSVFIESGHVETTGETADFVYAYTLCLFVMNFAGDLDDFTLPLMAWLWQEQPQLLLNPEKNKEIKFTTAINNDDTADLFFELPISERVIVSRDEAGKLTGEHKPEPRPRMMPEWGAMLTEPGSNNP